jgi:hypothetical protein
MNDKITLKKFVEKNQSLLTVAGVFAALTAFFSSAYEENLISLFTFIMFLLLCWELWLSFPQNETASTNLKLFEFFFMMLVFGVVFQILCDYKDVILMLLFVIFFAIYTFLVLKIVDKIEYFIFIRKIAERYTKFDPLIRSLGFFFIFGVVILLSLFSKKLVDCIVLSP